MAAKPGATRLFGSRYEATRRLGAGNFGTAWLVRDLKAEDDEPWKVLKEIFVGEFSTDETVSAVREARLLSKMNHPNIVKFHDSFVEGDVFCIVTEYCEGGDLDVKIKQWSKLGRTFNEQLITTWCVQLLLGIKYIHERRILHRDLKARNIFLKNNMIKLGDFGISRFLDGTADMATTFTGTPYYMSPEVVKHKPYNSKSDIWSLGCVIFELCCLRHAFEGPNFLVVLQKIVRTEPPSLPRSTSPSLSSLVSQMLTKDPDHRSSAVDLLRSPLISTHVKRLKHQLDQRQTSISAERDAAEIAAALGPHRRKSKKKTDSTKPPSRVLEADTRHVPEPASALEGRAATPRERARQRKMQLADRKAEELKKYTENQLQESRQRYVASKQTHWVPPWVKENPEVFEDSTFSVTPLNDLETFSSPSLSPTAMKLSSDEDELRGNIQAAGQAAGSEQVVKGEENICKDAPVDDNYIPEDPEEAETLYSQYDGFESDSEEEFDALLDCMQDAIDLTAVEDTRAESSTSPDSPGDLANFSPTRADQQIQRLRGQCVRVLGEENFKKVYTFLKKARLSTPQVPDADVHRGLKGIVSKPSDCFIVDQLIFYELQDKDG